MTTIRYHQAYNIHGRYAYRVWDGNTFIGYVKRMGDREWVASYYRPTVVTDDHTRYRTRHDAMLTLRYEHDRIVSIGGKYNTDS
jgi:hypothetical protein